MINKESTTCCRGELMVDGVDDELMRELMAHDNKIMANNGLGSSSKTIANLNNIRMAMVGYTLENKVLESIGTIG